MHVTIASKNKFFISIDNFLDHIKKYILVEFEYKNLISIFVTHKEN